MIKTYHDRKEVEREPGLALPERAFGPGTTKVLCPCGSWRHAALLMDVRHLPHVKQDWACDGCYSDWQRHLKPIDGGAACADLAEWNGRFISQIAKGQAA